MASGNKNSDDSMASETACHVKPGTKVKKRSSGRIVAGLERMGALGRPLVSRDPRRGCDSRVAVARRLWVRLDWPVSAPANSESERRQKALKLGRYELTGVERAFESRCGRSLFAGVQETSTPPRGSCHVRAERLMLRSGTTGVGEYERDPPKMSTSCSCRTTEYLGSRRNFGTESFNQKSVPNRIFDAQGGGRNERTLDINLKTEVCASSKRCTTS